MLVFSPNGGSAPLILSRQSQFPVLIHSAEHGSRLLTVSVLAVDGNQVWLNLDLDSEIPTSSRREDAVLAEETQGEC